MAYTDEYNFQDRMAAGKQAALDRRNKGLPDGRPAAGWKRKKYEPEDSEINRVYSDLSYVQRQLAEAQNEIARLRGGAADNDLDSFGAEFDRLFGGGAVGAAPPAMPDSPSPARKRGANSMTKEQYLQSLTKLRLKPAARETARLLGKTVRHCQRYAKGSAVPETVAMLIRHYLEHGLPDES